MNRNIVLSFLESYVLKVDYGSCYNLVKIVLFCSIWVFKNTIGERKIDRPTKIILQPILIWKQFHKNSKEVKQFKESLDTDCSDHSSLELGIEI